MELTFEMGDPERPRGHALLYFRDRDDGRLVATYVLVLPVAMDIGKYLPPLLGGLAAEAMGGALNSFPMPPIPEAVDSLEWLQHMASMRGDDLVNGGTIPTSDLAAAIQETAEVVQAYAGLYQRRLDPEPEGLASFARKAGPPSEEAIGGDDVQRVLYELMSERDRLGELSKLVGAYRFGLEHHDAGTIQEAEASMQTLAELMPGRYWADRVLTAAGDLTEQGTTLASLYLERCFKLLDEEYAAVEDLERRIADALGG